MLFTFTRHGAVMEREMAYTADVNRWRGPDSEPYRPHMRIHPGMVIGTILGFLFWWPVGLAFLFFTLRSTNNGLLESFGPFRKQDAADAVQDGADARPHGASRLRFSASVRPRAATGRSTNTAWKPCGALRKSRPNFAISSIACVTPRTRKSSTSSWPSIAPVRHRPRMASRNPESEAGIAKLSPG